MEYNENECVCLHILPFFARLLSQIILVHDVWYPCLVRTQKLSFTIMMIKYSIVLAALVSTEAFAPVPPFSFRNVPRKARASTVDVEEGVQTKPTGTSFLPEETIERCKVGSPIEKIKLEKDGTAAFVDVYEYARKIREGEMTWEEVEKADLDSVRRCSEKISEQMWHQLRNSRILLHRSPTLSFFFF